MAISRTRVTLTDEEHTDKELEPLMRALNNAIDEIKSLTLRTFWLSDRSAELLASFVARSSVIEELDLAFNHITVAGYKAIAGALFVNSSLRVLSMWGNSVLPHEREQIDACMAKAIRGGAKPRPDGSLWRLYSDKESTNDYERIAKSLLDDLEYK